LDGRRPRAKWLHELKSDGYRLIAGIQGGKAGSRRGFDQTARFRTIAQELEQLPVQTAMLDGGAAVIV
jgi:bifunctional non-homologous end joining protein LigD